MTFVLAMLFVMLLVPPVFLVRGLALLDVAIEDFGEPGHSAPAGLEAFLAPCVREVGADHDKLPIGLVFAKNQ
jgi:hypothetical protein